MDWLKGLTEWLLTLITNLWNSFIDFLKDFWIDIAEMVLSAIAGTVETIPKPGFLEGISLGSFLSHLPNEVLYFVGFLQLPEAFSLIASGVAFRLARKVITLFQW